jgi:hypothetical protein
MRWRRDAALVAAAAALADRASSSFTVAARSSTCATVRGLLGVSKSQNSRRLPCGQHMVQGFHAVWRVINVCFQVTTMRNVRKTGPKAL